MVILYIKIKMEMHTLIFEVRKIMLINLVELKSLREGTREDGVLTKRIYKSL
jgi:hypothetical protein